MCVCIIYRVGEILFNYNDSIKKSKGNQKKLSIYRDFLFKA